MKQRILDYIRYQFRNIEKTKEVEEAMEEAFLNLMDLYQSFLDKGDSKENAYLHAIENLGDFYTAFNPEGNQKEEYPFRPSWSEASMVGGLIASIFSVPMIFIHNLWGFLFLFFGLVGFFVPAYFYYKHARFVLEEKKDVLYHNQTLKKIFTFYLYQSFAWIVSISILISSAITSIVTQGILFLVVSTARDQIVFTDLDNFLMTIFVGVLLFLIIFGISFILMRKAHKKVYEKYVDLTGDTSTNSPIQRVHKLFDKKDTLKLGQFLVLIVLLVLYFLPSLELRIGNTVSPDVSFYSIYAVAFGGAVYTGNPMFIIFVFLTIFLVIVYLMEKKKQKTTLRIFSMIASTLMLVIFFLSEPIIGASYGVFLVGTTRIFYYILFLVILLFGLNLFDSFKKKQI